MRSKTAASLVCGFGWTLALTWMSASFAAAQGVQSGELVGVVRSADGLVLPGVTVTAHSSALQGERTVVTDVNGAYVIRALPPGRYEVKFELVGMTPRTETVHVELARTTTVNAELQVAGVQEQIEVTAERTTAGLTSAQVGANYAQDEINRMPTSRTVFGVAELAPGLTTNTPNASQVTISGGFAYDNVFMINGVDVADNLFGSPNNVFIEDAIEQTTVLTSAIPAEYGRFSGGVVNAITRSGSNRYAVTFRVNLSNPAWTDETPFEKSQQRTRTDTLNKNYEATVGGPVLRDRLWFFGAGRWQRSTTSATLPITNLPFDQTTKNTRWEANGTATLVSGHTIRGNYIKNDTDQRRVPFSTTIDPNAAETPSFPNDLAGVHYDGVISSRLLASLQASTQRFGFRGVGGTDPALVESPFRTLGSLANVPPTRYYNAPYFDATDPEDRDNRQFAGSLAYFATSAWGSHDVKGGFEHFTTGRTGGNSQSATGYVVIADFATAPNGAPLYDAAGRLIPVFVPGESWIENYIAVRGSRLDTRTLSLYLQDRWSLNPRLSLNVGVRYENVDSEATGGIVGVDTHRTVPRLAATWDVHGDGSTIVQGSFGQYSGKYNDVQVGRNSTVGNPNEVDYLYEGPAGAGRNFAPGFDLRNYREIIYANFPTINVAFDAGLSSPVTSEASASIGRSLGNRGFAKLTYTHRSYSSFIEDFIDNPTASGRTQVIYQGQDLGEQDIQTFRNSDLPERVYDGFLIQANYRWSPRLSVDGHWTVQSKNDGNFEGEAGNQPGNASLVGDYPEVFDPARNFPMGHLNDFQRHRVRIWGIYRQEVGRFGAVDLSPMLRIESGTTASLFTTVGLSAIQNARNPGYASPPGGGFQTLYFGPRGSEVFKGFTLLDVAATYEVPIYRTTRPWIKIEILNVANNQKLIRWDTTVRPDPLSPRDANGLPTGYIKASTFGQGTSTGHYPGWRANFSGGRTFLLSAGVRF